MNQMLEGIFKNIDKIKYHPELVMSTGLTYKGKDIRISYRDQLPNRTALACSVLYFKEDHTIEYRILIDEYFYQLSDDLKVFCIAHEIGHILSGHQDYKNIPKILYNNLKRKYLYVLSKLEVEADAYAIKELELPKETVEVMLHRLYDECIAIGLSPSCTDIMGRIKALK